MNTITYAIGDIHGCRTELVRLLAAIDAHAAERPRVIVFLGDYIDKGPDSAGVIEILMELARRKTSNTVFLKGNHDDLMLRAALGDNDAEAKWLTMDGSSVLRQFSARAAAELPRDVVAWFASLPTLHEDEHRIYVHAGLDPDRSLDDQPDEIRLTMRGAFLERDFDFGKHVAHGHTPQVNGLPDLRPYRSDLDTNVVQTGCLTAAVFEDAPGPPAAILSTRPHGDVVETRLRR